MDACKRMNNKCPALQGVSNYDVGVSKLKDCYCSTANPIMLRAAIMVEFLFMAIMVEFLFMVQYAWLIWPSWWPIPINI